MNQHFRDLSDPDIDLKAISRRIHRHCMTFRGADVRRSTAQMLNTIPAFLALMLVIGLLATNYFWASLLLAIPAGGLLVRIFIFQHDCGHGSFLPTRQGNDRLGMVLSLLTLTPYDHWKRSHATHHASSGNLERRGVGDIDTLTVGEYRALSVFQKMKYRVYRNLIVQLVIGAPLNFLVLQRTPSSYAMTEKSAWISVLALNAGIVLFYGALMWLFGPMLIIKTFVPVVCVAAWSGGWLFYVQHQYEMSLWDHEDRWDFHVAALFGSSHYVLPKWLQWLTGNIGLHHIHHLCSGVPNYRLEECLNASEELRQVENKLTLVESFKSIPLALWDEAGRRMISFRQYRALAR
ncbi:MAG: fatty acid desaturase [Rhizobiaceae bacterium]